MTKKVKMDERRKHHHFLSIRHSSSDRTGFSVGIDVSGVAIVVIVDISLPPRRSIQKFKLRSASAGAANGRVVVVVVVAVGAELFGRNVFRLCQRQRDRVSVL